jgi:hypothetical protein
MVTGACVLEIRRVWRYAAVLAALAAFLVTGCGGSSSTSTTERSKRPYEPRIRPGDFGGPVDNLYFPLIPGSRWVYEGKQRGGTERTVVVVTPDTKAILGVANVVVHDTVSEDGTVKEDTFDWYAQDREGNVWYFGEDTKELENGVVVSTEGSWEAGVDGAKAGIIMKARPRAGVTYRQEYYRGHALDFAQVVSKSESVTVPAGTYRHVLKTKEFTPLEPKLLEHKYYARGVGVVREATVKGGADRVQLMEYTRGPE